MNGRRAHGSGASFDEAVAREVRAIPAGEVLSYGDVAKRAGAPRAARAVARSLGRTQGLPWWRVIRSDGTLAEAVAHEQARLLRAEGVRVVDGRVTRASLPKSEVVPRRSARHPAKADRRS